MLKVAAGVSACRFAVGFSQPTGTEACYYAERTSIFSVVTQFGERVGLLNQMSVPEHPLLRAILADASTRARRPLVWCAIALLACAKPTLAAEHDYQLFPYSPSAVWFPPPVPVSGEAITDNTLPTRRNYRLKPPSGL